MDAADGGTGDRPVGRWVASYGLLGGVRAAQREIGRWLAAVGTVLDNTGHVVARLLDGSAMGRLMRCRRTRTAGIRFEWAMRSAGPYGA